MKNKPRKKTKKFKVRVPVETLVHAYVESLYFNEKVASVKIVLKKNSNQEISILCTGRGRIRGKITKDVAELWVTGTEEELLAWAQFFKDFVKVPEFSLHRYLEWVKGKIKP